MRRQISEPASNRHPQWMDQAFGKLASEETLTTSYTYGCIALYIFLSTSVILFNKWLLYFYGFPFPIAMTILHMAFSSVMAFLLVKVFKVVEPIEMAASTYITRVVPIGLFFAASLWFGNSAYLYISVSFIQMLKSLMPVAVYLVSVVFRTERPQGKFFLNMLLISFGVGVSAYGEIAFVLLGVIYQLSGILCESLRLVITQILLQSKGLKMNPITSLYYVAPCSMMFLLLPCYLIEVPKMREALIPQVDEAGNIISDSISLNPIVFSLNALCAFFLNVSVFLVIGRTSATTMRVAGVVKDWLLISLSAIWFKSPLTVLNVLGYAIAFLGVILYNFFKQQDAKAAALAANSAAPTRPISPDSSRLPLSTNSDMEQGQSKT